MIFEGKTESILMDLAQKHSKGEGHYWWKCVCWRTAKCILLSTVSVYMSWTPPGRLQPSHQGSESVCLRDMLSKCHLSLSPDFSLLCVWVSVTVLSPAIWLHCNCLCLFWAFVLFRTWVCMLYDVTESWSFLIMKLNSIILDNDWKSRHTKSELFCF